MILTNRLNLPSSIVNAVRNDPYSKGDAHISVTGLIGPARKRAIEIAHAAELTEDVAERIWALMGQIAHGILERADDEALTEERLFLERHGWRISGQFDRLLLENGLLQDYKITSTYSIKEGAKPEWVSQLNIYALMLRKHGYRIERGQAVVILRDWQKSKARHTPEYPQTPAVVIDIPLWPTEDVETFITARLTEHGHAQHKLPLCTAEERWARPATYALWKDGNQKATRLFATAEDAKDALAAAQAKNLKALYRVEIMPERSVRCADYCLAYQFCEQGKALTMDSLGLRK